MSSHPHGLALTPGLLPVHPRSCPPPGGAASPPPGGAVSPQTAAPSSDGCGEGRLGHVYLQVAVVEAHGPEGMSWVPET